MASYTLIGNNSIVQVLSPTVSEDMEAATIQTIPTGIIATALVSQTSFKNNQAAESLTAFADNIETIIGQGKAVGGSGTSDLEVSGLQAYFVTFTVGYNPPGAPTGTVTTDVDVPVNILLVDDPALNETLLGEAEAMIDKAYNSLVAMSQG